VFEGGGHSSTGRTSMEQVLCQYLGKGDSRWIHVQFIPTYLVGKNDIESLSHS